MKLTERIVQNALYAEIGGKCKVVVPNFTPENWSECDVWAVSGSGYAVEHEIKLSAADFAKDFEKTVSVSGQSHNKHEMLQSGRLWTPKQFYFLVSRDIEPNISVPDHAGLKTVSMGCDGTVSIHTVKQAPFLHNFKVNSNQLEQAIGCFAARYWRLRFESSDIITKLLYEVDRVDAEINRLSSRYDSDIEIDGLNESYMNEQIESKREELE